MTALETRAQPQLRVVAVGHVDHGKSTLIGRLLHDTGNLSRGKVEELQAASERRGAPFEWSFVLDALQSERDQAVTIDTTRIWMRVPGRDVVLIDAPGHKEFLRNMVTGASDADAALLLVDAHDGVGELTRRHALLLELIGVSNVVVAINKMDRVGYARARYDEIRAELEALLTEVRVHGTAFVPTCARDGENVARAAGERMPWYAGPTVLAALLELSPVRLPHIGSLRIAVQGVVRRDLRRIIVGRIESGSLQAGQAVTISPAGRGARVDALETWPAAEPRVALAGESVGFTLDGPLFVERGDVVSNPREAPTIARRFRARLLWLGRQPLVAGGRFKMRLGTRTATVEVAAFERVVALESLARGAAGSAATNDVAEVVFTSREPLALDTVAEHPALARFILLDGLDIVAGGTVLAVTGEAASRDIVPVRHVLDRSERERRSGHRGAVLWLTGLPASGKSTLAMELERRLFERGCNVYVLDGDNVRAGLTSDLGFSPAERHENVRRVGEVAALFADAGTIAIAAFVSPHRLGRAAARRAAGAAFHEIYVRADAALCERRDPKGHYAKARAGELPDFTGLSGDYEEPVAPDLVVDTATLSFEDAVETLYAYVSEHIVIAGDGVAI